jgi:maleylacetate reductase
VTSFTFDNPGGRVVFGNGSVGRVAEEVERLGLQRAFVFSTPGRAAVADSVAASLGSANAGVFANAVTQIPEGLALQARSAAEAAHADCMIAIGGGSSIGLAKAVSLSLPIPILAIPTTYSGSEMTSIYGISRDGRKETGRAPQARPAVVIYDPELTLDLPPRVTACSGLNAIAHCVEAVYASDANALVSGAAMQGFMLLAFALPDLVRSPRDPVQRGAALQGAWLAGYALGLVQMGLHHKLCHVLGGSFGLPHAETHAVLLPYVASYNRGAAEEEMAALGDFLESEDTPSGLLDLAKNIGAPLSLEELGFEASNIDAAASLAVRNEYPNPREVTESGVRELLSAAFAGDSSYVLNQ